jgi:3-hydroxyacyl-[acyl-carrier-protein] dehydratase
METTLAPNWNWLDRVTCVDLDRGALSAERTFVADEWFFKVHFPGCPVVPGVILIEAMAHALGVLGGLKGRVSHGAWRDFALLMVEQAKFYRLATPGTTVSFDARLTASDDDVLRGRVTARSDIGLIARADIGLTSQAFDDVALTGTRDPFGLQRYLARVLNADLQSQFNV